MALTTTEEQQALLQSNHDMPTDLTKPEGTKGDASASAVVWVSLIVFLVATWAIVLTNDPASLGWAQYHPPLQSLAITCFSYGILTLQPTSQPHTKAAGLVRHQIAMGLGGTFILLGALAMIVNKNSHEAAHFTTWHGTLGIVSVAWIVVQALIGGSTVWFGGAVWGGGSKAKALWKYHRLSGYILFPVILFAAHLGGGWSSWAVHHSDDFVRLVAYSVAPLLIVAGVYARVRTSKMKFF